MNLIDLVSYDWVFSDNRLSNISIPSSEFSIRITTNPNPVEDMELDSNVKTDSGHKNYPQISSRSTSKPNYQFGLSAYTPAIPLHSTQPPIPARKTRHLQSRNASTYSKPPPVPPHRSPRNLNEIKRRSGEAQPPPVPAHPPPVPPHRHIGPTKRWSNSQVMAQNLAVDMSGKVSKSSDRNKSKEKLDYKQLMEYFDGLKESSA